MGKNLWFFRFLSLAECSVRMSLLKSDAEWFPLRMAQKHGDAKTHRCHGDVVECPTLPQGLWLGDRTWSLGERNQSLPHLAPACCRCSDQGSSPIPLLCKATNSEFKGRILPSCVQQGFSHAFRRPRTSPPVLGGTKLFACSSMEDCHKCREMVFLFPVGLKCLIATGFLSQFWIKCTSN